MTKSTTKFSKHELNQLLQFLIQRDQYCELGDINLIKYIQGYYQQCIVTISDRINDELYHLALQMPAEFQNGLVHMISHRNLIDADIKDENYIEDITIEIAGANPMIFQWWESDYAFHPDNAFDLEYLDVLDTLIHSANESIDEKRNICDSISIDVSINLILNYCNNFISSANIYKNMLSDNGYELQGETTTIIVYQKLVESHGSMSKPAVIFRVNIHKCLEITPWS